MTTLQKVGVGVGALAVGGFVFMQRFAIQRWITGGGHFSDVFNFDLGSIRSTPRMAAPYSSVLKPWKLMARKA